MKITFLSTGYCELLRNAISKMFPIGCMMDNVRYEQGASIFQTPATVMISDESLDPTLSDSLGNADLALLGLMVSSCPEPRNDQRTVLIGFSLVIELYEEAEDCYVCEPGELVRQLRDQSGTEGYYSLALVAYAPGNSEQHRTLMVSSTFILPSYEVIASTVADGDVISRFLEMIGDSEWITWHMSEYVRSLAAMEAQN
ncbi:MAG: hypothetical protein HGB34_04355 [Candidatus Moranbacteria bacterium]|nr:hypothetical protein [Candidatus Moranbacteria bacterium]